MRQLALPLTTQHILPSTPEYFSENGVIHKRLTISL